MPYSPPQTSSFSFGDSLNRGSEKVLDSLSDVGGWWKGVKQDFQSSVDSIGFTSSLAASPDAIHSAYPKAVGRVIASADDVPLSEGLKRVPSGLPSGSLVSRSLGVAGSVVDGVTGSLDVLEALHDEGGKPGKKTMKTITKSAIQIGSGTAIGAAVATGLATAGVAVAGAPLILGIAAGAGASYLVSKGLDYIFG